MSRSNNYFRYSSCVFAVDIFKRAPAILKYLRTPLLLSPRGRVITQVPPVRGFIQEKKLKVKSSKHSCNTNKSPTHHCEDHGNKSRLHSEGLGHLPNRQGLDATQTGMRLSVIPAWRKHLCATACSCFGLCCCVRKFVFLSAWPWNRVFDGWRTLSPWPTATDREKECPLVEGTRCSGCWWSTGCSLWARLGSYDTGAGLHCSSEEAIFLSTPTHTHTHTHAQKLDFFLWSRLVFIQKKKSK